MPKPSHTRFRLTALSFLVLCAAVLAVGCGSDEVTNPPPDYAKTLADSPTPLAAIHAQGNEILEGGKDAFDARMETLDGFPAVVNIWGSWCGPCRAEFPHFQQVSSRLGRKVAFLGVDANDGKEKAEEFLATSPVPYPSFFDPDNEITDELGPPAGMPATAFFDASGNLTYLKQGPYTSDEQLEDDIQTHAIDSGEG